MDTIGLPASTEVDDRLSARRQTLLNRLVALTGSCYVLLRIEDSKEERLRLVDCAKADHAPDIVEGEFEIPLFKSVHCWFESPVRSWGKTFYPFPSGALDQHENCDYSEAEKAFVRYVKHKASFPILLDDGTIGIVILVSGCDKSPYSDGEIAEWWILSQVFFSMRIEDPSHTGFIETIKCLSLLNDSSKSSDSLQLLAHCLASGRGLRNNRVWIFQAKTLPARFICKAALGEINAGRWKKAVDFVGKHFDILRHELADVAAKTDLRDELWQACVGELPIEQFFEYDDILSRFNNLEQEQDTVSFSLVDILRTVEKDRFVSEIKSRIDNRKTCAEYQCEPNVFWYPISNFGERFLVLVSSPYVQPPPPYADILTSVFIEAARRIPRLWSKTTTCVDFDNSTLKTHLQELGIVFEDEQLFRSVVSVLGTPRTSAVSGDETAKLLRFLPQARSSIGDLHCRVH